MLPVFVRIYDARDVKKRKNLLIFIIMKTHKSETFFADIKFSWASLVSSPPSSLRFPSFFGSNFRIRRSLHKWTTTSPSFLFNEFCQMRIEQLPRIRLISHIAIVDHIKEIIWFWLNRSWKISSKPIDDVRKTVKIASHSGYATRSLSRFLNQMFRYDTFSFPCWCRPVVLLNATHDVLKGRT